MSGRNGSEQQRLDVRVYHDLLPILASIGPHAISV